MTTASTIHSMVTQTNIQNQIMEANMVWLIITAPRLMEAGVKCQPPESLRTGVVQVDEYLRNIHITDQRLTGQGIKKQKS